MVEAVAKKEGHFQERKRLRKEAKAAAKLAAEVQEAAQEEAEPAEAKKLRKTKKRAAVEQALGDEVDPAEAKRLRKAAKQAAAEQGEPTDLADAGTVVQEDEAATGDELTVFVGGVPFECDEATLRQDFAVCGDIKKMSMPLTYDGRSSGTAYITFKTKEGAAEALKYDNDEYGGRTLAVKVAGKVGERGAARGDAELEVCVKGLPNKVTDTEVRDEFAPCGDIQSLRLPRWPDGGAKGMAFVTFKTSDGFAKALALDGKEWGNWYISVRKAGDQGKGSGKDDGGKGKKGKDGKGKGKAKGTGRGW